MEILISLVIIADETAKGLGGFGTDTLYFNNLVQTKTALPERWMIPIRESWLAPRPGVIA